ncbi:hypothetical protein KC906_02910, partial [Candidatus Kaiserbacteria bacterium]|nr:hypothetical protein [Candidatus Kaiserbacteria bacterium]
MSTTSTALLTGRTESDLYRKLIKVGETQARRWLSEGIEQYLVRLLVVSGRMREELRQQPERRLALIYGEAREASSLTERAMSLHELGFEGLKLVGFFPGQLKRRQVSLSYAAQLTTGAYAELATIDLARVRSQVFLQALIPLSQEIAANFEDIVAVL